MVVCICLYKVMFLKRDIALQLARVHIKELYLLSEDINIYIYMCTYIIRE